MIKKGELVRWTQEYLSKPESNEYLRHLRPYGFTYEEWIGIFKVAHDTPDDMDLWVDSQGLTKSRSVFVIMDSGNWELVEANVEDTEIIL